MFTKKDRKIANLNQFIEKQRQENLVLYEENKQLRIENQKVDSTLNQILKLVLSNTYNCEKIVLNKIKELAQTAIRN